MSKQKIIDRGTWYIVQMRLIHKPLKPWMWLYCANRGWAGYDGWDRRTTRGRKRKRTWSRERQRFRAYRFAGLHDVKQTIRGATVRRWL